METDLLIALRLAKEGYGTVEQILAMPADLVLATWEYVGFLSEYEETLLELNKSES